MRKLKLLIRVAVSVVIICTVATGQSFSAAESPPYSAEYSGNSGSLNTDVNRGEVAETDANDPRRHSLSGQKEDQPPLDNPGHPNYPPYFVDFSESDTMTVCLGDYICDTIEVADSNATQTITISLISGPGDFSTTPSVSPAYAYYCYLPETEETIEVTFMAKDSYGDSTIVSKTYVIYANQMPTITTGDTTIFHCYDGSYFYVDVDAFDPEGDPLEFRLHSYQASIDSVTGLIKFWAAGPGVYCHTVSAFDGCTADTAEICVTVVHNSLPEFDNRDYLFTLCQPETICFEIFATDPDIGDSLVITQLAGPGTFAMTSDTSGQTCFMPDELDSADYIFIYEATDDCLRVKGDEASCPPAPRDTVIVTVRINSPPVVSAGDTAMFLCDSEEICLPVEIDDPDDNIRTIDVQGADLFGQFVCFRPDTSGLYEIIVTATDSCDLFDADTIRADIQVNSAPVVTSAEDFETRVCVLEEICFDIHIDDVDHNAMSVATNIGHFNPVDSQVCFTPPEPGVYHVITTVTDSCYASHADTTIVTVTLGDLAAIDCPPGPIADTVCGPMMICHPLNIDPDDAVAATSLGSFADDTLCFMADTAGTYIIDVIADAECGSDTCRLTFNLTMGEPIIFDCPDDTSIFICEPDTICIPFSVVSEDVTVTVSPPSAWYDAVNESVCFYTNCSVEKDIKILLENECGLDSCLFTVDVTLNSRPLVILPPDMDSSLCEPEQICIPVGISDIDDNLYHIMVSPPIASYDSVSGRLCYTPGGSGRHVLKVRAIDSCGAWAMDSVILNVTVNSPPTVVLDDYMQRFLCEPEEVCFPVAISDPDDNITGVSVFPEGTYDPVSGKVCFMPTNGGSYQFIVTATDSCDLSDQDTITVDISVNRPPDVAVTPDTTITACVGQTEFCVPVFIFDRDDNIEDVSVVGGFYRDDFICIDTDTPGTFQAIVTVTDSCDVAAADTSLITVIFNRPPVVTLGDDFDMLVCDFEEICFGVGIDDPDDNIVSKTTSLGDFNTAGDSICFIPDTAGSYTIIVAATDFCEITDADTININVALGQSAYIDCPEEPYYDSLCHPDQICVPLTITPSTAEVTTSYGAYVAEDSTLCFYADTSGTYSITVIASELCGADTCKLAFIVEIDEPAEIVCPDQPITATLCEPENIAVLVPVTPAWAAITVQPFGTYNFADSTLTFFADTSGHYEIMIIATTWCGADTCVVEADVTIYGPPEIVCPGEIDTLVCLPEVDEICFDVEVTGSAVDTVVVLPDGYYSDGTVCVPVTEAGRIEVIISASGTCGEASCTTYVDVTENLAPDLYLPEDMTVAWCEGDTTLVCIDGIYATDPEDDPLTIIQSCGPGEYIDIRSDSGQICFTPDNDDTTYEFCLVASDGCSETAGSFFVTVYPSETCDLCVEVWLNTDSCYMIGSVVPVHIDVETYDPIGGFDLLVGYDVSVMDFWGAEIGDAIDEWEYFTYRIVDQNNCPTGCPSGLMRYVGIADQNNGPYSPPVEQLTPNGELALFYMRIKNDLNLGGRYLPLNFYWLDCGDNAFSDPTGTYLYVDSRIYNAAGSIIWDESDDELFPESERFNGLGAPDSCLVGGKISPVRCVYFHDGWICVLHPDSIDARGDVNLNNVPYEIADAVVFTNYFIYSFAAFTVNVNGQIAATDINADGYTLTLGDLVYLIRVISGDANPLPKVSPGFNGLDLAVETDDDRLTVMADARCAIGAGLLVFEYDGVIPKKPLLGKMAEHMDMIYTVNDNEVRILIYSLERGRAIDEGSGALLEMDYSGTGSLHLRETEFASYYGVNIESTLKSQLIPVGFAVSQNYPNPFNPSTSIDLALPTACDWSVSVFNVNGRLVRRLCGHSEPGTVTVTWDGCDEEGRAVSSGIYLYRVEALDYSLTKKMIMLK